MDSVLEYDSHEIQAIKEILAPNKAFFKENAQALFEDCFMVLTATN
jgi:hypothetical protein